MHQCLLRACFEEHKVQAELKCDAGVWDGNKVDIAPDVAVWQSAELQTV